MFFSSTTSRFWALIQMCMHQLGYKGSLHGYFASQCLLIWKFLPRNKLDWLCRLMHAHLNQSPESGGSAAEKHSGDSKSSAAWPLWQQGKTEHCETQAVG